MALKQKLTKELFLKLSKDLQSEYLEKDGEYLLDVEGGVRDETSLLAAKDHEKKQRKAAEADLKAAREELATITAERDGMLEGSVPKSDVEKLKTNFETRLSKREKELLAQVDGHKGQLTSLLVDNVATSLAAKISTAPKVILPHIRARLKAEEVDGKLTTRVLDSQGQVTQGTIEDLEKEFLANKDFSGILTASRASGGGANGANRQNGGADGSKQVDRATFDTMSQADRATHVKNGGTIVDQT